MINSLKQSAFRRALANHPNFSSTIEKPSVNASKSILIYADISDEADEKYLDNYQNSLRQQGREVSSIFYHSSRVSDDILGSKSILWNGTPEADFIENILGKRFDVYLHLSKTLRQFEYYIARLAKAQLKIGPGCEKGVELFDFMVDKSEFSNAQDFVQRVENQLALITKKTS